MTRTKTIGHLLIAINIFNIHCLSVQVELGHTFFTYQIFRLHNLNNISTIVNILNS